MEETGGSLRAGCYGDTPIQVSLSRSSWVPEESEEMADTLTTADETTRARVRCADARFEVSWNLSADPDPVPETADLMLEICVALTGLTGGVALLGGSQLLDLTGDATDQFFD